MKKAWKRLLTWGLCLSLLLSYGALAADMMPMDGMGPPPGRRYGRRTTTGRQCTGDSGHCDYRRRRESRCGV